MKLTDEEQKTLDDSLVDLSTCREALVLCSRRHVQDQKKLIQMQQKLDTVSTQNEELLEALTSMTRQYLSISEDVFSHDFMSAGEETLALLVKLGLMIEFKPSYYKFVSKGDNNV